MEHVEIAANLKTHARGGDSGNGLMAFNPITEQWIVGGVLSFGYHNCGRKKGFVSCRFPSYNILQMYWYTFIGLGIA